MVGSECVFGDRAGTFGVVFALISRPNKLPLERIAGKLSYGGRSARCSRYGVIPTSLRHCWCGWTTNGTSFSGTTNFSLLRRKPQEPNLFFKLAAGAKL